MPPSPSLSARRMIKTYLTVTMSVIDQIMMDKTCTTSSGVGALVNVEEYT